MEASCVEGWEDEVARLDKNEVQSVVEHPAGVAEQVCEDLRQPQEAKDDNRVKVFGHNSRAEKDQGEGYEKDGCYHVGLAQFQLLGRRSLVADRVEGYRDTQKGQDGADLPSDVYKEHRETNDQVEEETSKGPRGE